MNPGRPFALLRTGDQWVRCRHDATFLDLAAGVVELAWETTTQDVGDAAPALIAGLAFDSNCRLLHSLPDAGRVERILWAAFDPTAAPAQQPGSTDLFEVDQPGAAVGDFAVDEPAPPLREPRGLAVDTDDRLFIAETVADRIEVFDLLGERLIERVALAPGSRPTDLAVRGQQVWAVLAGSRQLIRLGARSAPVALALPAACTTPSRVAVSPGGQVAVLADAGTDDARVWFMAAAFAAIDVPGAGDIEWESDAVLVVARGAGADFLRFGVATGAESRLPPLRGRGYDGLGIVAVPADSCCSTCAAGSRRIVYWSARGPRTAVAARLLYQALGRLTTYRLDSGSFQTEWGRLFIDACMPEGAQIRVHCVAVDETDDGLIELARTPPANLTALTLARPDLSPPMPPTSLAPGEDPLPQTLHKRESGREMPWTQPGPDDAFVTYEAPVIAGLGRYLWVTLELRSNTRVTPKLKCLRAEQLTHDYLRRLPRTFSRDPAAAAFLSRYLAIFEGFLGEIESRSVWRDRLLDPRDAPAEVLPWLASFVGLVLDERWAQAPSPSGTATADVRRQYIEEAAWLFRYRGTLPGLKRFIEIYTGIPVVIVEHWRLRGLGAAVLGDSGDAQSTSVVGFGFRVGGEIASAQPVAIKGRVADAFRSHAHRFTVIIPAALSAEQLDVIKTIVDVHRPAHTVCDLCTVDAGMRVGQSLLVELTSVIGRSGGFATVQLGASVLGRGSLIGRPLAGARLGQAGLGRGLFVG